MESMFLICAAIGGTVLVCQFVLTLIGLGGDDVDLVDDLPDDMNVDGVGHLDGGHDIGETHAGGHGHGSTWMFGVVSFRTVIAALTFFGLGGYAAIQGGLLGAWAVLIATICGAAAMYGVHWLMQTMYRLGQDRTLRIQAAVGRRGTVYVPIPGGAAGEGKVHVSVQDRMVEYAATTSEPEELPTGARVVVIRIISPSTVEVERIHETAETADA
jgi:membrane protein implicated in regulation of membrane protease activity